MTLPTLELSDKDFTRLAQFINGYSGIRMPASKRAMVEGRLRRRLVRHGFDDFGSYCRYLFEGGGMADEAVHIIDAVTTNKTEFFREPDHFDFLAEKVLPDLLRGRDAPSLKLWSAACSVGAEPYSLAMLLAERIRQSGREIRCSILATDLCIEVLEKAIAGIYSEEMIRPIPLELRRRYLLRSRDPETRLVRISPDLRRLVRFSRLNLMDDHYDVDPGFHIIFCRNVLIYFSRADQERVLGRLAAHLAPGGYLFLGHSETVAGLDLPLRPAGPTVFIKS
ncbi:chemotaxis protein methyltransferase [mine drainage metagenome]|uniref:protein-glutamate O-methyltransferase n=1 Tax=mine drainage metagenome TaxID=410659 RepID=A0A1J5RGX5_9ZZZZ